jgi:hypothetical protein
MNDRERVAHHEAAHAVLSLRAGFGVSGGIDLDAQTSVEGAFGNAAVALSMLDADLPTAQQQMELGRNLSVICAGAASDARILEIDPEDALLAQPGDYGVAIQYAAGSSIIGNVKDAEYVVTQIALPVAVRDVGRPEVWQAIERLAAALLEAGGRLDRDQVEALGRV